MSGYNIFSKRQKILRGEQPKNFVYNALPTELRNQIIIIIHDAFGKENTPLKKHLFKEVQQILCREYGKTHLSINEPIVPQIIRHFFNEKDNEKALDVVELLFNMIDKRIRNDDKYREICEPLLSADEAINELNHRFKENGVGFQYEAGYIIRLDNTYAHQEIVKPTISLLSDQAFQGANDEYLKAHEYYRHGQNKECLNECLKAFESTIKIICKKYDWEYNEKDNAKTLIKRMFDNELIPKYLQDQLTSIPKLLESGVPVIRNKEGAHGQGQTPKEVDDETTRYALNLTGANIIYLVELSKKNK